MIFFFSESWKEIDRAVSLLICSPSAHHGWAEAEARNQGHNGGVPSGQWEPSVTDTSTAASHTEPVCVGGKLEQELGWALALGF